MQCAHVDAIIRKSLKRRGHRQESLESTRGTHQPGKMAAVTITTLVAMPAGLQGNVERAPQILVTFVVAYRFNTWNHVRLVDSIEPALHEQSYHTLQDHLQVLEGYSIH